MIPGYSEKLKSAGFNTELISEDQITKENIKFVYFKTPFANSFFNSSCFLNVPFIDGIFLKPMHIKSVLIILAFFTSDHIIYQLQEC